nr:hypothetical protein GCM10020241_03270 [Streptoalloteichus tenebrarius]
MSSLTPYVMAPAKPFTHFIKSVFDAEISHVVPLPMDPERVMHAEARIGTGVLFFADSGAHGEQCQTNPTEPAHIQMWVTVPDPDAVFARAVAAGGPVGAGDHRAGGRQPDGRLRRPLRHPVVDQHPPAGSRQRRGGDDGVRHT